MCLLVWMGLCCNPPKLWARFTFGIHWKALFEMVCLFVVSRFQTNGEKAIEFRVILSLEIQSTII
jgi:hypothetical protein